jgi:sarcosine oxidase
VLRAFAERYFPDGAGPTVMLKTCMFTNSPDEHFLLGRCRTRPGLALRRRVGPRYKFASVVGRSSRTSAIDGVTGHDIACSGSTGSPRLCPPPAPEHVA